MEIEIPPEGQLLLSAFCTALNKFHPAW